MEAGFVGQARFWADSVKSLYRSVVRMYSRALPERLLPAFSDLNAEADEFMKSEAKRLGALSIFAEDDGSGVWEQAHDDAVAWYTTMQGIRQGTINLHAVGLRHLFEQQLFDFGFYARLFERRRADYARDKEALEQNGIVVSEFKCWKDLEELRLLANAVKHAEGSAAENLRKIRPQLFIAPFAEEAGTAELASFLKAPVIRQPLAGDDLYVRESDISRYSAAVEGFWDQVSERLIEMHEEHMRHQ